MKYPKSILLVAVLFILNSCGEISKQNTVPETTELTDEIRQELIREVSRIADLDQKYRSAISLGTLDQESLQKDKEMRETASMEEYVEFSKTIEKTLSQNQIDSLWVLQHELDDKNYKDFKSIIKKYGYPSPQRLKIEGDHIYPILLHPPNKIEPRKYLDEMNKILKPEVLGGRMDSKKYATFVDNIKAKILKEPQLFGTNKSFNPQTMSMGLPIINNLEETNKARKEIGLSVLDEGEFELLKND